MKKTVISILLIFNINIGYGQSVWDAPSSLLKDTKMDIVVYRSPTCGCCGEWLAHLKKHDFNVIDHVVEDVQSVKAKYGVGPALASCHTAIINGYVVEGHVPASDIKSMLKNKENIKGLAVPGMVAGSPGMEMGNRKAPFKVIAFDKEGQLKTYNTYDKY
ncbi:MAG: DUF411 domain-containing protein [Methyloprofundus sp.]|nr:DUF411 domain-containing protein [Methyloprofundus sp.]